MNPADAIRSAAVRLDGAARDYDALLEDIGERPLVLLGEATHGTREFYRMRAEITQRLVAERKFNAVAVEADWPDAYRLNRYVRGDGDDVAARSAFGDFRRFPQWMWRNLEVLEFVEWLREYNAARPPESHVGFYGLDMYSLYRSAEAVIAYLDRVDYEQAAIARRYYAALDHVRDPQRYGYEAAAGLRPDCRDGVRRQLIELVRRAPEYAALDGRAAADAQFFAERNADIVVSAEAYYRTMFGPRHESWNLRDTHMTRTLFALRRHLRDCNEGERIVVWAHNSHLGDARATEMGQAGECNIGQLVRESAAAQAYLVGFTTCTGTVMAAHEWDEPGERQTIVPAREDSYEGVFRRARLDRFYLRLQNDALRFLNRPMLERAIGVLYRPQTEYASHYFLASLASQFDAVFHLDETEAVEPF
ncbi:MAG TPA: erythromycin esterase family protein [Rudaea sp.]|nr:erythromycin esterase family protein [Rudaea sp.]